MGIIERMVLLSEAELSKEYKEMLDRDHRRWKAADKSKDDFLDKDEYICFMHPETCDDMKDIIVAVSSSGLLWSGFPSWNSSFQETIEDIDKNKDGVVDLDEYIRKFSASACLGMGSFMLFLIFRRFVPPRKRWTNGT